MERNTKRVLVTGSGGFLGRYVVSSLKDHGFYAIGVDNIVDSRYDIGLDITQLDEVLRVFQDIRPEILIHLAAVTGASGKGGGEESFAEPFKYLQTNSEGTLCVFEACRRLKIHNVIHMSSFSVYGETKSRITEETNTAPITPYGFSKLCGELLAKCYAINYGIKTLIFRAPLLAGKGQRELNALREFATAATQRLPIVLFNKGSHLREWLHPQDVAEAFIKGIEYFQEMTTPYETFVLGGEPISMESLARLVIREAGRGAIEYDASERRVFDQLTDASKVWNILGWKPIITTEKIVREVVAEISDQRQGKLTQ